MSSSETCPHADAARILSSVAGHQVRCINSLEPEEGAEIITLPNESVVVSIVVPDKEGINIDIRTRRLFYIRDDQAHCATCRYVGTGWDASGRFGCVVMVRGVVRGVVGGVVRGVVQVS